MAKEKKEGIKMKSVSEKIREFWTNKIHTHEELREHNREIRAQIEKNELDGSAVDDERCDEMYIDERGEIVCYNAGRERWSVLDE